MSAHYSTETLNHSDGFEAWREHVRPVFDLKPYPDGSSLGFHSMTTWSLGEVAFCQDSSPGMIYERSSRRARMAANDHYQLYFLKRGGCWGTMDGGVREGHSSESVVGRVGLYSLAQPCHGELRNVEGFTVFVPRDSVGNLTGILDAHLNDTIGGVMGELLSEYLLQVESRLPELTQSEAEGISRSILELVKACYANRPEAFESAADVINTAKKMKVRRLIQTHLSNPRLSVDSIARDAGMSRSSLYRLFEIDGGIASYVDKLRFQKALSSLQDMRDTRSISQVATDCGFAGSSDLNRLFKRRLGCSPRDVRRLVPEDGRAEWESSPQRAIELALQKSCTN